MLVSPFYSPLRGIALEDVWHNNSACPVGESLAAADRRPGMVPYNKRCRFCALLDGRVLRATRGRLHALAAPGQLI